ncbi:MAG: type II secretion system protein, partial [Candidatus Hydrogenedentes bacterium]|nr:type II secretion system protein [Candidatus Hydrogenedentota bacterium]
MNAPHLRRAGFTLIELLTVIAIIGILTAFTAAVLPNILEKARLTNTQNVANQLRILLTAYYTEHGTYPPAYGYIKLDKFGTQGIQIVQPDDFVTLPWMATLGEHGNLDLYDPFSTAVDVNVDEVIEMLEYSPVGGHNAAAYAAGEVEKGFFTRVYNATADIVLDDAVDLQFAEEKRPFIYI